MEARRIWRTGLGVVGVALAVGAATTAQTRTADPVATIAQIQRAMVSPASNAIFDVGRQAPSSDAEWQALEDAAVIVAEAGNLFLVDGRRRDDGLWTQLAGAMADAGASALASAERRDVDGVLDAGNTLIEICEACHQPYRDGGRPMGPPPVVEPR